jgi:hypothetical protein
MNVKKKKRKFHIEEKNVRKQSKKIMEDKGQGQAKQNDDREAQ